MFDLNKIQKLDSILSSARKVSVAVHQRPDGDAVGSGSAMVRYLRECRGLEAGLVTPDAVPDTIMFINGDCGYIDAQASAEDAESFIRSSDLLICLDFNTFSRTGVLENTLAESKAVKVLIDHHLNPSEQDFDLVFSKTDISSASELEYWILRQLQSLTAAPVPLAALTALMCGMTTDTNNFANSVFPSTLEMASELLAAGVDRDNILLHLYGKYRENRFRAMGFFLSELMHITPEGVAYAVIDTDTLERFDIREGELEGFVNMPLGIENVRMSITLKQADGVFHVSVRSRKGVSACMLARTYFHGGGHENASGGRLYFPEDIERPEDAAGYVEEVTARFMRGE